MGQGEKIEDFSHENWRTIFFHCHGLRLLLVAPPIVENWNPVKSDGAPRTFVAKTDDNKVSVDSDRKVESR